MSLRVLFVDDEQRVLDGIARMLFTLDVDWEVGYALGGPEALAALDAEPADVVVSDMRMPVMNGAELLSQVREKWPRTLRIVLSGHTEQDETLRALKVAHRLLSKPCDGPAVVETIERMAALEALLQSDAMKDVVGRVGHLPPAPRVFQELGGAVDDPNVPMTAVVAILERDPAIAAKVLHIANSAFFRRSRPIGDLVTAVARIGLATLRSLVLASEVFGAAEQAHTAHYQRRALLASLLARRVAPGLADPHVAATAALLAEVGRLIPDVDDLCARAVAEVEHPLTFAEVGACLLGLWGLPTPIVEAVAHHREPDRVKAKDFGAVGVVHVVVALACGDEPDAAHLARHGLADRIAGWRQRCAELAGDSND